jgi:hypothetical protein
LPEESMIISYRVGTCHGQSFPSVREESSGNGLTHCNLGTLN